MKDKYHYFSKKSSSSSWFHIPVPAQNKVFKLLAHISKSNDIDFTLAYIADNTSYITLNFDSFKITGDSVAPREGKNFDIMNAKTYTKGCFESDKDHFFFLTYSENDFSCGYYDSTDNIDTNIQQNLINKNESSPLEFNSQIKIEYINFIYNNKYAYYKINNFENNKNYYGILDTKENKVVFNTEEEILIYIPYSDISMLAITSTSAYEICVIKKDGFCIDSSGCPDGNYILNPEGNKCASLCGDGKFFLIREEICSDTCDESIYILDNYQCGLCKQLNSSFPYKLMNSSGCFSSIPDEAEVYNNDSLLLKCKSGYKLEGRICSRINPENTEENTEEHYSENIIKSCPDNYVIDVILNTCVIKTYDNTSSTEFKEQLLNNITAFVNSSTLINGSDFIAVILSSDDMDPKDQIKKGISAINLGNCTEQIKEYYNISKNESLIILNLETKRNETKINEEKSSNDKSINVGKSTQIEIYDYSGRKLNLSVCKEDITIMKYIGDLTKELDINNAISMAESGVDVFNASDEFFNNICHEYDNNGVDIIIDDRREDIYKNVSFCDNGCSYKGMDYDLMIANCVCDSSIIQNNDENNIQNYNNDKSNTFNSLTKSVIASLLDFNLDVIYCYNLVFNLKYLKSNIGFYCMIIMFILQLIFFFIYALKKLKSLKYFMLTFKNNNMKYSSRFTNGINNKNKILIENNKKDNKNKLFIKKDETNNNSNSEGKVHFMEDDNDKNKNNLLKMKENNIKDKHKEKNIISFYNVVDSKVKFQDSSLNMLSTNQNNKENKKKKSRIPTEEFNMQQKNDNINNKTHNHTKDNANDKLHKIKSKTQIKPVNSNNIRNKNKILKENNLIKNNKKQKRRSNNLITLEGQKELNNKNGDIKLLENDEDLQDMDYDLAIIYDKRSYLRMYWAFLVDSQIILGTFCTENYLNLFVIKLSFFIFTFQINFFLNALFYTDEYISDAYHNDGVLDFISGLPKSIYSFIATLVTTNLLRMLSNSKSELKRIIREKRNDNNYIFLINMKLGKLRKKLIVYFIILFTLGLLFIYYVTVFCSVYRNSQKYWFIGCLQSFGMDSAVAVVICFILVFLRYLAIYKRIKCFYCLANFINTFL